VGRQDRVGEKGYEGSKPATVRSLPRPSPPGGAGRDLASFTDWFCPLPTARLSSRSCAAGWSASPTATHSLPLKPERREMKIRSAEIERRRASARRRGVAAAASLSQWQSPENKAVNCLVAEGRGRVVRRATPLGRSLRGSPLNSPQLPWVSLTKHRQEDRSVRVRTKTASLRVWVRNWCSLRPMTRNLSCRRSPLST
jgi:hypothetical protein